MSSRPTLPSPGSPPEFLTVDEAAELLRVNRNTVYEAIKNGEFPGVMRLGKRIRIRRSALLPTLTTAAAGDLLSGGSSSNALTEDKS